jgi:hypothetical protein
MDHNLLLVYLSELGSGSWIQFRQALDFLAEEGEELYRTSVARNLSALGHVEFAFYDDMRWTVCPPVLAWLPRKDKLVAALCGARSQRLEDSIRTQAGELGLRATVEEQPEGKGPAAVFVEASSHDVVERVAALTGVAGEYNAAGRIARCLPSLDSYGQLNFESPEPSGYEVKIFDVDTLQWEVPQAPGEGLYEYSYYRPEYRLKLDGSCLKTTREVGVFLLLRHEQRYVLRYDPDEQELLVPVRTPLPALYGRAATLCSGMLPDFTRYDGVPTYRYREVPAGIARAILTKLDQSPEAQE